MTEGDAIQQSWDKLHKAALRPFPVHEVEAAARGLALVVLEQTVVAALHPSGKGKRVQRVAALRARLEALGEALPPHQPVEGSS